MAARWRIVNDTPSQELQRDGRFASVREITFEVIDTGQTGHVTVRLRDYSPENVAAAIQPYADNILAVSTMEGGG